MDGATIFSMVKGVGDAFGSAYADGRKQALDEESGAIFDKMLGGGGAPTAAASPGFVDGVGAAYKRTAAAPTFAATGGGMGEYLAQTRARESGGNDLAANPNSTAKGRYQFTDQTWKGVAQRHPDLGLTPGGWRDSAQQEKAMAAFTGDNAKALTAAGLPINPANLYGSHFLGEAGGPKFIAGALQNPDQLAGSLVSPGAVRANRSVFFHKDGRPKSAGEVYSWMGGQRPTAVADAAPTLPTAQAPVQSDATAPVARPDAPTAYAGLGPDAGLPAQSGGGLGGRFSPEQISTLRAAYRNPTTRPMATQMLSAVLQGKDAAWSVVDLGPRGKALLDGKSGRTVPIPNTEGERKTAVVGGNLVYTDTGEVAFTAPAKPEGFTLAPGQTRYEGGQPVASAPDRDKSAEGEARLRGEFGKQLGSFNDVQDAYGRVLASVTAREANPDAVSPASDIALVFGYMKMLDPGSVVREGEYATAKNAAGIPTQVANTYNKLLKGEFLAPEQRQDFVDTAGRVYGQARQTAEGTANRYRELATGQGLDVNRVVALPEALTAPKVGSKAPTAKPKAEGEAPKAKSFGQVPIPMPAANALRADPGLRDQFDAKYGKGAANRVLGSKRSAAPTAPTAPSSTALDPSLGLQ